MWYKVASTVVAAAAALDATTTALVKQEKLVLHVQLTVLGVPPQEQYAETICVRLKTARIVYHALQTATAFKIKALVDVSAAARTERIQLVVLILVAPLAVLCVPSILPFRSPIAVEMEPARVPRMGRTARSTVGLLLSVGMKHVTQKRIVAAVPAIAALLRVAR